MPNGSTITQFNKFNVDIIVQLSKISFESLPIMCNDNWEHTTVFRKSSKNIVYYTHPDNCCTLHNSRYSPAAQFVIRDKLRQLTDLKSECLIM